MSTLSLGSKHTIYYEFIEGKPDLPVLVFLHEGLGCCAMWDGFVKSLCRATQCPGLMYDRLGYGKSDTLTHVRTLKYLHDYAFDELPSVIDAVIPAQPYILIGHSDGGSIALIHSSKSPLLLKAVITEAAHVFVEPVTLDGIRVAEKAFAKGKLQGLYKFHSEKTQTIFHAWSDTWLRPEFKDWNIESLLPDITAPLLVMQGVDDQYASKDQVDSICENTPGPAAASMVDNCGHSPHAEQPGQVENIMARFIQPFLNMK